jgi:FixJ family two-component response regulator
MNKSGHVYLVDHDASVRASLSRMLQEFGYNVHDFASAKVFIEHSVPISPAVILLDMQMSDMTGLDLQEELVRIGRKTPIVFISGQNHPQQIVKSLKKGVLDFLFKPFNLEDLLSSAADAIEFDRRQLKRVSKYVEVKHYFATLTPREKEVCHLLVQGLLNKDIAVPLGATDASIKFHKARVMEKMRTDSLQALVRSYLEASLDPSLQTGKRISLTATSNCHANR